MMTNHDIHDDDGDVDDDGGDDNDDGINPMCSQMRSW